MSSADMQARNHTKVIARGKRESSTLIESAINSSRLPIGNLKSVGYARLLATRLLVFQLHRLHQMLYRKLCQLGRGEGAYVRPMQAMKILKLSAYKSIVWGSNVKNEYFALRKIFIRAQNCVLEFVAGFIYLSIQTWVKFSNKPKSELHALFANRHACIYNA